MPTPQVSVVLPTYNEADSLPVVVPQIVAALSQANLTSEVIVVDDASPDGTAQVAQALAGAYPVRVLRRDSERGLATAVLAGFNMSEASICVVMDADGSHPVSALPNMVRTILEDRADIVVGSRHVEGGGSRDWPFFLQFKSWLAATAVRGLTTLSDPTSGYMAVRRDLVRKLQLDPVGWKIVLEVVVKAAPARVVEVPIVFADRELGQSKQNIRVMAQYLKHCYRLYDFRYPAWFEFARFCLVGFLGIFVDLAAVAALKGVFALDTRWCAVGGFSVAVTTNYAINRTWTFKNGYTAPWVRSYFVYVGANLVGLGLRIGVIHLLMRLAGIDRGYGYLVSNFIGIVVATAANYLGAKYLAFGKKGNGPA